MKLQQKKSLSIEELEQINNEKTTVSVPTKDETNQPKEKSANDKYYLPVLYLNHKQEWEPKPLSERRHFTDEVAMETCLGNCCGVEGLKGACCQIDPNDLEHVLGPVTEDCIKKIVNYFRKKGMNYNRHDIVIDYEEGKIIGENLFKEAHNAKIFEDRGAYPMMRFQVNGPRYLCKFMNPSSYKCQIYEVRPTMCSTYYCNYVTTNFLVKTKVQPNRWRKLR